MTSLPRKVTVAKNFLFSYEERETIWRELLSWYDLNKKDLPWRKPSTHIEPKGNSSDSSDDESNDDELLKEMKIHQRAYEVLVSELMLQQTQVETVKKYFVKWMKRFPTIKDLSDASDDDVHGAWSGLGYYKRARNLHAAAKYVVQEYNKPIHYKDKSLTHNVIYKLPDNVKDLMNLKGVGKYTAGAVASIAFGRCASIVDGNVFRVFARLKQIEEDIAVQKTATSIFWPMADNLISHFKDIEDLCDDNEDTTPMKTRYGDLNQAIMELGRTICIPRNPKCGECPIADVCSAFKAVENNEINSVEIYPVKKKKTKKRAQIVSCCIFYKDDDNEVCLYEKRHEQLLGGTWHFPLVVVFDEKNVEDEAENSQEEEETQVKSKKKKNSNASQKSKKNIGSSGKSASTESDSHLSKLQQFLIDEGFIDAKHSSSIPLEYHSTVNHVFSHINQTNHIYSCSSKHLIKDLQSKGNSDSIADQWKWFDQAARESQGISEVAKKIFRQFKKTLKNQEASPVSPPKVKFKIKSPFVTKKDESQKMTDDTVAEEHKSSDSEESTGVVEEKDDKTTTATEEIEENKARSSKVKVVKKSSTDSSKKKRKKNEDDKKPTESVSTTKKKRKQTTLTAFLKN
ncbi:hypothetical protein C9374_000772 [Naegleria lovaniensis]|uniref:Adenine DNA glycosylase n=1 Tax=Naegleria lovaniensis TaxID=51637 RepID=A0AA88GS76_NAELO|nr:uncharacterized protein C9374_000772 [Naegleria lovaniensis]KAG2387922.1 hypothetical protein C9374_000772 [Naegleria lovaniensis]